MLIFYKLWTVIDLLNLLSENRYSLIISTDVLFLEILIFLELWLKNDVFKFFRLIGVKNYHPLLLFLTILIQVLLDNLFEKKRVSRNNLLSIPHTIRFGKHTYIGMSHMSKVSSTTDKSSF